MTTQLFSQEFTTGNSAWGFYQVAASWLREMTPFRWQRYLSNGPAQFRHFLIAAAFGVGHRADLLQLLAQALVIGDLLRARAAIEAGQIPKPEPDRRRTL